MHFDPLQAVERDPVVTDVHTDVGGELPITRPPTVLHVGTGDPRPMIVTLETCQGPRAYAGVVSSYHEFVEPGLTRLTDEEWSDRLQRAEPEAPEWMTPLLGL